jgi:hypothetical protein
VADGAVESVLLPSDEEPRTRPSMVPTAMAPQQSRQSGRSPINRQTHAWDMTTNMPPYAVARLKKRLLVCSVGMTITDQHCCT